MKEIKINKVQKIPKGIKKIGEILESSKSIYFSFKPISSKDPENNRVLSSSKELNTKGGGRE